MHRPLDDDALARSFAYGRRDALVIHDAVRPTWSADGARFTYATRTPDGPEHRLVDLRRQSVVPLFDRVDLAKRLADATGAPIDPATLTLHGLRLCDAENAYGFDFRGKRWKASMHDATLICLGTAPDAHRLPSPDRSAVVFLRDHNLWLADTHGETPLTTDGTEGDGYGDFSDFMSILARRWAPTAFGPVGLWSPDSRRIAVMKADLRKVRQAHLLQSSPAAAAAPQLHSFPYPMPGDPEGARLQLHFIDRDGGQVRAKLELTTFGINPLAFGRGWWDPDSNDFYLLDTARDANAVSLWRIDSVTGEAILLLHEDGPGAGRPSAGAPICKVLLDGRVLWWSQRDGWGHLYLIDPDAPQQAVQVTAGAWTVREVVHVDEAQKQILFLASGREAGIDPYFNQVYVIGFDGYGLARLTPEGLNHDLSPRLPPLVAARMAPVVGYGEGVRGVSPDGAHFVDSFGAANAPPRSVVRDRAGRVVLDLGAADVTDAWPQALPMPEPFSAKASDRATELWGVLYKPAGFDATRRYPIVEIIYAGPQDLAAPKSFRQTFISSLAEQIAAIGMASVILDGPGTPFRSRDFGLASYGKLENSGGVSEHADAILRLAADRPWIDTDRIGVLGMSSGGYAAFRAMAARPDVYRAGVCVCGNHDQRSYLSMWGDYYQGLFTPELYAAQANTTVAAQVKGAVFLIHGEMDDNVHPAHSLKLADALIASNIPFDLLIVPNAGHGVAMHPYVQTRMWDFLRRALAADASESPYGSSSMSQ
jgi:dipeptidyl aminopeptidase/acylaminoacyl peptidase